MQFPTDPVLAAAVDAADRVPLTRLLVDWSRDGNYAHALSDLSTVADAVTVERSITGDLPPECSLVEGYTSATLTAALGGQRAVDPRDIARMLSPYRSDGPLYRQQQVDVPVRLDLGLATTAGPRWVRQFTGTTRSLRATASTRTVQLDALDPAERLRAAVTLPVTAASERAERLPAVFPYKYRFNTQWVLDYVLRRNGIYFSPPPRPGCLFAMTCHGGLAPDIGSTGSNGITRKTNTATPEFVPGAYGLAANGGPTIHWWGGARGAGVFSLGFGEAHLIEAHIKAGASNTFNPDADGTIVAISTSLVKLEGTTYDLTISTAGQLAVKVWSNPTTSPTLAATLNGPTLTGPAAWHSVGVWVKYDHTAKTITHRWQLDGVVGAPATVSVTLDALYSAPRAGVTVKTPVPVQCIQVAPAAAIPAGWGTPHVSEADLDVGLNWMTGLPDIISGESWSVIKASVAAEYGLASFTEAGRFQFRNRDTARTAAAGPAVKAITAATSLTDLEVSVALDSVRNQISHTHAARLERDEPEIVYQPTTVEELDAPPGTTRRTVRLSSRCHATGYIGSYTASTYPDATDFSGFVATNANTGAAVSNVTVTGLLSDDESTVELTFSNPNAFTVRFQIQGRPAFRLVANPVTDDNPTRILTTNPASIARYGRRVLDLPDNPFRQHPDPANAVTASLLADLADPVPILADVPVVGDPRVQLADVVTLADPTGLGGPITGSVIALRRTQSSEDGLADSLTIRARPPA
ncbi:hypothetical protein [Actinokineospora sp.]|uniref:hypothetical protein n=1 Tax=Actinokineospora sp. TaxID=1872133 RepID=UPI003D6A915C